MTEHDSHGHSLAAWTGVGILLFASLVMSIAVVIASVPWFVVGAALVLVGLVAGKVMSMAGYGARASTRSAAEDHGRASADVPGRAEHDSGTA